MDVVVITTAKAGPRAAAVVAIAIGFAITAAERDPRVCGHGSGYARWSGGNDETTFITSAA